MKKYQLLILLLVILIIIITGIIIYAKYFEENIIFTLFGDNEITLYEGESYIENGFIAYNENGDNLNNKVQISSNLDINKVGRYTIKYSIKSLFKRYVLKRNINVIVDNLKDINFKLEGISIVNLSLGNTYIDSGFVAINKKNGENLIRYVNVESNVNTNKIGNYEVKYHLVYNGKEKVLIRKVNVLKETNSHSLSTIKLTNKPIEIKFQSYISNFAYVVCPNDKFMYNNSFSYYVFENGKYTFYVYDSNHHYEEYTITINNIDRVAPTGSCTAKLLDGKTIYAVKTLDTDINRILYNNENKYASSKTNMIVNKYQRSGIVTLVDEAGNRTILKCIVDRTYLPAVYPIKAQNIVYNAKSESLQFSISYQDGYYISYIWVKDPYLQLKKELVENNLMLPKKILQQAITKHKYNNKLIFSTDASGSVKKGLYYDTLANNNSIYDLKEPSALNVYNGKVIVNDYEKYAANGPIYYVNGNNILTYILPLKDESVEKRKKIFEEALDSDILNTFGFSPILVIDGKAQKVTNDYYALRNGLCQLDENNFISVVSKTHRWDRQDFANFMAGLGCKTAVNFDGGGSVALFYKERNSEIKTITGNERALSNVLYFVEL